MKIVPAQLRVLLAAIVLIAGSAVAGAGPAGRIIAGQVIDIGPGIGVAADADMAPCQGDLTCEPHDLVMVDEDHSGDCQCGYRLDCPHSGGSGCCTASISAVGDSKAFDCAQAAVRFIAGKAFLATGIDPEALLQPPRF